MILAVCFRIRVTFPFLGNVFCTKSSEGIRERFFCRFARCFWILLVSFSDVFEFVIALEVPVFVVFSGNSLVSRFSKVLLDFQHSSMFSGFWLLFLFGFPHMLRIFYKASFASGTTSAPRPVVFLFWLANT